MSEVLFYLYLGGSYFLSESLKNTSRSLLNKLVECLVHTNSWHVLKQLLLGEGQFCPVIEKNKKLPSNICVSQLILACTNAELKEWGQLLAIELLRRGSSFKSLVSVNLF